MRDEHQKAGYCFRLVSITKPVVCVLIILMYSLRSWKGMGKKHDLEKIAHYADLP